MDAFAALEPISAAYASLPVAQAFDWTDVAWQLGDGDWYLVAFRSIRRADTDEARLTAYDDRAHMEAAGAPGFVYYFRGPAAADGSCLSFCLWTSRAEARAAAGRPDHRDAVELVNEMYARHTLEFLRVTGRVGHPLAFEPYDSPTFEAPSIPTLGPSPLPGALPATS